MNDRLVSIEIEKEEGIDTHELDEKKVDVIQWALVTLKSSIKYYKWLHQNKRKKEIETIDKILKILS